MPKRKRKESNDDAKSSGLVGKQKTTASNAVNPAKKSSEATKPKQQTTALLVENEPSKPSAVRIIVGSYEKVLCGVDARFDSQSSANVWLLLK